MQNTQIFTDWPKRKLEKMTYYFSPFDYKRKQVVFNGGDRPEFVYIVYKGEFELMKEVCVDNGIYQNQKVMVKVALLNAGEVFGEKEVLLNQKYSMSCSCYSTVGTLLRISVENFLLKFEKKVAANEVLERRRNKYKIRDQRMQKFKQALLNPKLIGMASNEDSVKINYNYANAYRRTPAPTPPKSWNYSPLTKQRLQDIKKRALGYKCNSKIYFDIHASLDTNQSELISKAATPDLETDRSWFGMKCHRPGGYYRGNLKKPRPQTRNASEIIYLNN